MAILDPGLDLSLRPMKYPQFYKAYLEAVANNWRVEEVDFHRDVSDLRTKMSPAMQHMIKRLVAFFATGDSLVANNVATVAYRHVNAPEARMYLARQTYEEALHVQFYLTLLDSYIADDSERAAMFSAVDNVPSIAVKAAFCREHMDAMFDVAVLDTDEKKQAFLLNMLTFAGAVEGLFFYAAFAYVFFLRSRGFLPGLGQGTNWVMRDESQHMAQAFEVVSIARREYPGLFTPAFWQRYDQMLDDAVAAEMHFANDALDLGVAGLSANDMHTYLRYVANQRRRAVGVPEHGHVKNPFDFLAHQDVTEMSNFFERRPTAYGMNVTGGFAVDRDF